MAVRKDTKNGKWLAEVYVNGKRSRKWFLTKGDALRFYNQAKELLLEIQQVCCLY